MKITFNIGNENSPQVQIHASDYDAGMQFCLWVPLAEFNESLGKFLNLKNAKVRSAGKKDGTAMLHHDTRQEVGLEVRA